jgi:transcriptional regulator with PAS, ATPase and Fis domain
VPPLRERGSDVELLFRYFATEFATRYGRRPISLAPEATQYLYEYHWPGNIRELRNFVEKLTVLTPPDTTLGSEELLRHLPFQENQLPVPVSTLPNGYRHGSEPASHAVHASDTEFVLRALFDLRNEVAELKRTVGVRVAQPYSESVPILQNENYSDGFQSMGPVYATILEPDVRVETVRGATRFGGSPPTRMAHEPTATTVIEESLSIEKKEKDLIQRALVKFDHNRKKAAQELGISERTLYRKIKAYNLD